MSEADQPEYVVTDWPEFVGPVEPPRDRLARVLAGTEDGTMPTYSIEETIARARQALAEAAATEETP